MTPDPKYPRLVRLPEIAMGIALGTLAAIALLLIVSPGTVRASEADYEEIVTIKIEEGMFAATDPESVLEAIDATIVRLRALEPIDECRLLHALETMLVTASRGAWEGLVEAPALGRDVIDLVQHVSNTALASTAIESCVGAGGTASLPVERSGVLLPTPFVA